MTGVGPYNMPLRYSMEYWSSKFSQNLTSRPSSRPFISGDSFREFADFAFDGNERPTFLNKIRAGSSIFCPSHEIDNFLHRAAPSLRSEVVLILGNSDNDLGTQLGQIIEETLVGRIFAQNVTSHQEGVTPLPIGLENLHIGKVGNTSHYWKRFSNSADRKSEILYSFAVQNNPKVRGGAIKSLSQVKLAVDGGRMSVAKHQKALLAHQFVASPPGNGIDTHRTWEAMYLGCVPIVLSSAATIHFRNLGLPLFVVDDYSELIGVTRAELNTIYQRIIQEANYSPLWMPYWREQIRAASRDIRSSRNWR